MEGILNEKQMAEVKSMIGTEIKSALAELAAQQKPEAKPTDHAKGLGEALAPTPGILATEEKEVGPGHKIARAATVKAIAFAQRRSDLEVAKALALRDRRYEETVKAMAASTVADGGAMIAAPLHGDYIDLLRANAVVRSMSPSVLPMPSGLLDLGRLGTGATAYYVGENTNATASTPQTQRVQLSAKKLMVQVAVGNDLLRRGGAAVESLIRNEIAARGPIREDMAFIRGDGQTYTPRGIKNQMASANAIAANSTVNVANVIADLAKLKAALLNGNVPMLKPGWIFAPRTELYLYTARDSAGGFLFKQEMDSGKLMGVPYKVSTQIPINLGTGTNESEVYLADFSEVIIGDTMNLEINAFNGGAYYDGSAVVSGISQDQTVITLVAEHDIALKHDVGAAMLTAVTWGA